MNRPRTRFAGAAGVVGAALVLAAPFAAAPAGASGIVITIDSPGSGETIRGTTTVTVSGSARVEGVLGEVDEVRYQLLRGAVVIDEASSAGPSFSFPVTLAYNGLYTAKVWATGNVIGIGRIDGYADRNFTMAVPPAPPTNVSGTPGSDRRVTLSWTGVSHPDLRGYAVYRKVPGGSFGLIGASLAGQNTFTEPAPTAGGAVQYQVLSLRDGAVPTNDPEQWLRSSPATTTVQVPAAPAPPPPGNSTDQSSTTVPPGGAAQPDDASNLNLGDLFSASPTGIPSVSTSPTPTLPDTGFNPVLPFGDSPRPGDKVGGRAPGRPSSSSASGDLSAGDAPGSSTNRRALLVPVAAGSVLCVAALHLRWLNRRLASFPPTGGGEAGAGSDFEPADFEEVEFKPPEPDPRDFDVGRLPVSAGR